MTVTDAGGPLNTRWLACEGALGRNDLKAWEFIIWINARWVEFIAHQGCKGMEELRQQLKGNLHPAFDAWLLPKVGG